MAITNMWGTTSTANILYVLGPRGETVIVTPPEQKTFKQLQGDGQTYKSDSCAIYSMTLGIIFCIIGLPFLGIYLGAEKMGPFLYVGLACTIPGVILIAIAIPKCKELNDDHGRQVQRLMHRDLPLHSYPQVSA